MKRNFFKQINVTTDDNCNQVIILKDRVITSEPDCKEINGVKILAWHEVDNDYLIQEKFIEIPENMIEGYIRDFSGLSAQEFVDNFDY